MPTASDVAESLRLSGDVPNTRRGGRAGRAALVYAGLVVVPLVIAWLVLRFSGLPGAPLPYRRASAAPDPYVRLLLAVPVILAVCHLMGRLFARLAQPKVIGEIFAGVALGPSALGLVSPEVYHWLFPAYLAPTLNALAQIGLIFFMYLIGYELNLGVVRRHGYQAAVVSHAGIAVPMLAGVVLAWAMYSTLDTRQAGFAAFALFLAVSMSITAFPVLARILEARGLTGSPLGSLALSCAAVDDVMAWCLLAVVVAVTHSAGAGSAAVAAMLSVVFAVVMTLAVRPALRLLLASERALPDAAVLPVVIGGVMLSALATQTIGIHPIFGAFLFGAIMPRGLRPVEAAGGQLRGVTLALLLPLIFVYTGLRTEFGLLGADLKLWGWCLLITVVAVVAKAVTAAVAARTVGVDRRDSISLGVLMNCRGLTELIVLNVGLSLKVISPAVFTMLVFMTLVSTMMTAPLLDLLRRSRVR
jgi:Kef-type K+ transport system membrane component KefB